MVVTYIFVVVLVYDDDDGVGVWSSCFYSNYKNFWIKKKSPELWQCAILKYD